MVQTKKSLLVRLHFRRNQKGSVELEMMDFPGSRGSAAGQQSSVRGFTAEQFKLIEEHMDVARREGNRVFRKYPNLKAFTLDLDVA